MNAGTSGTGAGGPKVRQGQPMRARWGRWVEESIKDMSRKLRIQHPPIFGGSGGRRCTPWKPSFSEDGGTNYVRFSLGLLNQMAADNWDTPIAIAADVVRWIVLDVASSNGRITGYSIALDTAPPDEDNINEDTPPGTFKIVLGVIDSLSATMAVCENLECKAAEVFRESRNPPVEGAEPFTRWWRWTVNQWDEGTYPYIA